MDQNQNPQLLRSLLNGLNDPEKNPDWSSADNLFRLRLLDSYSIIQLIVALETELGILFDFQDLVGSNFQTLETLTSFLNSKYACNLVPQV